MNALLMRRRFASVRNDILGGLKTFVDGGPPPPTTSAAAPVAEGARSG
jgi:hypothetical protein